MTDLQQIPQLINMVNLTFEAVIKEELRKRNSPIMGKHIGLFLLLSDVEEGITFKEVAFNWKKSKSTLCDIIGRYSESGLIEKTTCSIDRRNIYVKLTPKGQECIKGLENIYSDYAVDLLGDLSTEETKQLKVVLEHLVKKQ